MHTMFEELEEWMVKEKARQSIEAAKRIRQGLAMKNRTKGNL